MPADKHDFEKGGLRPGFEEQWLSKLNRCLMEHMPEEAEAIMDETGHGDEEYGPSVVGWTRALLDQLEAVDPDRARDVLAGCACQYPKSRLDEMRRVYAETGDLERVHAMLQDQFLETTKDFLGLNEEEIEGIEELGWGVAGVLHGDTVIATKMPFDWPSYWAEDDAGLRRFHYCHCPRVRDLIRGEDEPLSKTYCYCGAGFYKGIWGYILGRPVDVEVLETVMQGDDVCRIAVHLPEDA